MSTNKGKGIWNIEERERKGREIERIDSIIIRIEREKKKKVNVLYKLSIAMI